MDVVRAKVYGLVEAVQLRRKIDEAVLYRDDPPPVYLLDELVSMIGSNPEQIEQAVDAIVKRLQSRGTSTKQQTLRLIKHACQKGSPNLRLALARQSAAVKELEHYSCEPDPFKGDTPWKRVQMLAREALEAMHSSQPGGHIPGAPAATLNNGFGLSGASGGFGSASSSGSILQGGRPAAPPPPTISGGLFGSGAGAAPALCASQRAPSRAAPQRAPAPHLTAAQAAVAALCRAGSGARAAPPPEALRAFLRALETVGGAAAAAALGEVLQEPGQAGWERRLRALCGLEATLRTSSLSSAQELRSCFQAAPDALRQAARSASQSSVRERARRVLELIGDAAVEGNDGDLLGGEASAAQAGALGDVLGGLTLDSDLDRAAATTLTDSGGGGPDPFAPATFAAPAELGTANPFAGPSQPVSSESMLDAAGRNVAAAAHSVSGGSGRAAGAPSVAGAGWDDWLSAPKPQSFGSAPGAPQPARRAAPAPPSSHDLLGDPFGSAAAACVAPSPSVSDPFVPLPPASSSADPFAPFAPLAPLPPASSSADPLAPLPPASSSSAPPSRLSGAPKLAASGALGAGKTVALGGGVATAPRSKEPAFDFILDLMGQQKR